MKKVVVHKVQMGDVEDVELYAAEPLYKFEISDKGRWVMENALQKPVWYCRPDYETFGNKLTVIAELSDENATFFQLKWG
jgi:hypothetical protein